MILLRYYFFTLAVCELNFFSYLYFFFYECEFLLLHRLYQYSCPGLVFVLILTFHGCKVD